MRLFLILFLYCCVTVFSWERFRLGRKDGGNMGVFVDFGEDINGNETMPAVKVFKQKMNHFNPVDDRYWDQQYYEDDKYFKRDSNGPVFLMIGGEGPVDPRWMVQGAWIDYAKSCNALCFTLEHRYYGNSHPFTDTSTSNLQFLSSKQALADLANFIYYMNEKYNLTPNNKWIVFGGSYSGSLAAWMRLKYPHLVYAAVSSSGPLEAQLDFQDYYKVVVQAIHDKTGSDQCIHTLKTAQQQLILMMNMIPNEIQRYYQLCTPLIKSKPLDEKVFFNGIADFLAEVVQYNEDNRISTDKNYLNYTINTMCDTLTAIGTPFMRLGNFVQTMLKRYKLNCFDYSYDNMITSLRNEELSSSGAREWFYQTCTEFGFYQTSTGVPGLFGKEFDVGYFVTQCQDVFGKSFDEEFIKNKVIETNQYYGGLDIRATRVLYVQGSIDPWHALGLNTTKSHQSPVIYINGTAHCADEYPARDADLPALTATRVAILRQLKEWTA